MSPDQIEFAVDLFSELGDVTTRKMMGGLSIYSAGQIFSIMGSDGQIYLKATGGFAEKMTAAGAHRFSYSKKDGTTGSMGYWSLPDAAIDDVTLACDWAQAALDALN